MFFWEKLCFFNSSMFMLFGHWREKKQFFKTVNFGYNEVTVIANVFKQIFHLKWQVNCINFNEKISMIKLSSLELSLIATFTIYFYQREHLFLLLTQLKSWGRKKALFLYSFYVLSFDQLIILRRQTSLFTKSFAGVLNIPSFLLFSLLCCENKLYFDTSCCNAYHL